MPMIGWGSGGGTGGVGGVGGVGGGAGNSLVMEKDVPLLRPLTEATVAPCAVAVVTGDGASKPMGMAFAVQLVNAMAP
jgi:hypothetical protein